MQIERTMTTAQVAELLGISRAAILTYASKEQEPLPSIKVGTHYRFFPSDVIKYFKIPSDKLISPTAVPKAVATTNHDQEI